MSVLGIEILLHYATCRSDYRRGDFSAPEVRRLLEEFCEAELLTRGKGEQVFFLATRGRVYVDALCALPLPHKETRWVMP